MESDPLQQLRDIHLPVEPGWWPPAIGWWIVFFAAIGLMFWLARLRKQVLVRQLPNKLARSALNSIFDQYQQGSASALEYLNGSNELLKRLIVKAQGHSEYASLSGQAWLSALDELSQSNDFTNGPGSALGQQRFSREPQVDVPALNASINQLLNRIQRDRRDMR